MPLVNGHEYDISFTKNAVEVGMMTALTQAEFRRRDNDFAPVIGVPGVQLEYAEGIWRPWVLGDFRGGIGQEEWKDPTMCYEMTPGLRIFRNRVTLDTKFVDEDASVAATKGVDFKGDHYIIAGTKVRKRTTATGVWSEVYAAAATINDIGSYRGYIFITLTSGANFCSTSGASGSWVWMNSIQGNYPIKRAKCMRRDIYGCGDALLFWRGDLTAGGVWNPCDPGGGDGVKVGDQDGQGVVNGFVVIGGVFAIGRTNGIYAYEGAGMYAQGPVIDFENQVWAGNCKVFLVADGFLYYNVGNRLKRTNLESAEFDITPFWSGSNARDLYGFGTPVAAVARQGWIYVAFDKAENDYPIVLRMPTIDAGGWQVVYKGASGATMNGIGFSDAADRLWVNDGTTRTQRFQPYSDNPYPDYVASAYLVTPWFDAGDAWAQKVFAALLDYARDLSATEKITVYYEKDFSGSWVKIADFTSGRENQVAFDPTTIAIFARKLRLKIQLARGTDTSKTPVLEFPLVASYVVRPEPTYAQQVVVLLAEGMTTHDQQKVEWDAGQIRTFLRECEAYELPVTYKDRDGTSWTVLITRTEEIRRMVYTDRAGDRQQDDVMVVTLQEV